nr:thiol-disulfide oxidoreductase LTO1 [Ipomoea trifida]
MANLIGVSSSPLFNHSSLLFSSRSNSQSLPLQLKSGRDRQLLMLRVQCSSEQVRDAEKESKAEELSSPSTSSGSSISAYSWCAALGGIGFLETSYLTYLKLTESDAFCPVSGGSCGDILNSSYSVVFGVPLPLIGMVAYGVVAALGLQLGRKQLPLEIEEASGRFVLLGTTTSMAAASAYFLYILSTRFPGEWCLYCLISAVLSFSLFFTTVKGLGLEEVKKELVLQLSVVLLVVAALNNSYNASQPTSSEVTELPYFATEITTHSTPYAISLAKHLSSIGAKMYGAFWCSHCQYQKQMFGQEAAELLNYVECFPNGVKKGTNMALECALVKIEGFPMWVINGEVLNGDQELSELAKVSGFQYDESSVAN